MSPSETSKLILSAGGDAEFAKFLGIDDKPGHIQRVNNWKRRGMPSSIALEHYDKIRKLTQSARARSAA